MGNIVEYLTKIKTAIYGKDVRGAMHDAIKQVYDDAATGGDANMEVTFARGTENTLNDRLTKMDEVDQTNTALLATTKDLANQSLVTGLSLETNQFNFVDSGNYLFLPTETTGYQAGYTSVIRMDDKIANPIDNFYMYWAGHDGGGIRLSTAPHPLGPWTQYPSPSQSLLNDDYFGDYTHISSPSIVYHNKQKKFYLFYHGALMTNAEVQSTWRAESIDGLTFTNPIEVFSCPRDGSWDGEERSYFRVIPAKGKWLAVYQGRGRQATDGHAHIGYAESEDLLNWSKLSHPLWYDNQFTNYPNGWELREFLGGSPCLLNYQGVLWVFYANGTTVREIYCAPLDLEARNVKPIKVIENPPWSGANGLEGVNFLTYENKLYMFFHDYDDPTLYRRVGVAVMDLGVNTNG